MLPSFCTWQVVRLDLDGRKWKLNYTIMRLWPIARMLCVCESGIAMRISSVCTHSGPHLRNHRWPKLGTIHLQHQGLVPPPQRELGTSSYPSESYRGLSPPSRQTMRPDGIEPLCQNTYWPLQDSGSDFPTGRSTNWPCQRPARRQRAKKKI